MKRVACNLNSPSTNLTILYSFYILFIRVCISIFLPHSKCSCLHFFAPCRPHGLHFGLGVASTTKESSLRGVNPKLVLVEQNTAVTGALTEVQRCRGAESFVKFILASRIRAADCKRVSLPDRLKVLVCLVWSFMYWHSASSCGEPKR